ncbi:MAG: extracellular solute-binding protein family 1 [Gemmatimonadetes bacterium]|nr:extracellular solute-binding protein family 1 [Gemmatimonadota bacterium]
MVAMREIRRMYSARYLFLLLAVGCSSSPDGRPTHADTLVVFEAASLAAPMHAVLDSFARRSAVVIQEERGPSLELARRITELHRVPDVIALADQEVFPELLIPAAATWYASFARNRMVIAYTENSHHAKEMTADNWREILLRNDVLLGRTDPALAPAGYRALLVYELAERHYRDVGLAKRLTAQTTPKLIRGNAAELAALLSAGELDYIVDYESLAHAQHFQVIRLPADVDLGDAAQAAMYATASVRVPRGKDSVTRHGAPILYGVSIPRGAAHSAIASKFLAFLLGPDGRAILRRQNIDALDTPIIAGDSVPRALRADSRP